MVQPTNPYKKTTAAAPQQQHGASQSTMGPQSQRRLTLNERTHQLQSQSHRKKAKTSGQQTLFGEMAFDPKKDCAVCKGKQFGREVHRAHHELCYNNRRTKGFSMATLALQQEEVRLQQHFRQPSEEAEKCSAKHNATEGCEAFFTPREIKKKTVEICTTTTTITKVSATTISSISTNAVDADDLYNMVVHFTTKDSKFVEEHQKSTAPLAMLAFARIVVARIARRQKDMTKYFTGITMTVPAVKAGDMHPQYHSIVGQKLLHVDWKKMYDHDITCPRCRMSTLENDRTNFSKNKILFPIFVMEGPPLWCMVMSMTCPACKYRVDSNSGEILKDLPAHMRSSYPVEPKYAFNNRNCHLGRTATETFDLLMTTYGNGDLCSRLLFNVINRSYINCVDSHYSFYKEQRKDPTQKGRFASSSAAYFKRWSIHTGTPATW